MKKQQRRKYQPMPCFVRHPLPSSSDPLSGPESLTLAQQAPPSRSATTLCLPIQLRRFLPVLSLGGVARR